MKISTDKTYEKVEIEIDDDTHIALRMIAAREGISIEQLQSDILHGYLIEEASKEDKDKKE